MYRGSLREKGGWEIKGDMMWSPGAGRKELAKGRQGTDSVLEPPEGTTTADTLVSIP